MSDRTIRKASKNANRHTERGLAALSESISTDGWIGAMTTAADGEMIAGSARIETAAQVLPPATEPIIIESDGTRPIVVVRTDIPNAGDPRAQRLALADNRVHALDLSWDVEVLAGLDADVIGNLWTPEELSDLGQQWADVLGKDDTVDKSDRSGSSPWDRVEASGKVRCIIGELEFGIMQEDYDNWIEAIGGDGIPREAAERWFNQHLR